MKMNKEDRYDSLFQYYASTVELDWIDLKAQAKAESWDPVKKDFNPEAMSPAGAIGLTQFMKMTWLEWQDGTPGIQLKDVVFDRKNPERSIFSQAKYLKWLYKDIISRSFYAEQKREAIKWAFAAYNWGIGYVRKYLPIYEQFDNAIVRMPEETQKYVKRILEYIDEYKFNLPIEVNFPISSFPDFGEIESKIK